jgi:hypothetical protein
MKFQTTLALTLLLLVAMVGGGTVSGLYGYTLGHAALQGVKQPEGNPSRQLIHGNQSSTGESPVSGIQLMSEREVIVQTYDQIHAKEAGIKKQATPAKKTDVQDSFVELPDESKEKADPNEKSLFPLSTVADDLKMEITSAQLLGSYWVLDVSLQNNGAESVRFLYNFLEVQDAQGKVVSAQTEGLPGEVPANNQSYAGQIRIPAVILADEKKISVSLSDYPDQKITLKIADIPMVR